MMSHISSSSSPKVQMIDREEMLKLLAIGLDVSAYRFTRQAALAWLSSYPGDLEINLCYVIALIKENRVSQASQVLQKILNADPLFVDALNTGVVLFEQENPSLAKKVSGVLQALGEKPSQKVSLPIWGAKLLLARQALNNNQYDKAQTLLMNELSDSTHPELADILHLELIGKTSDAETQLNLARLYHTRWPECLQISLILAKAWMDSGNEDDAVSLLHYCAANDTTGQVPVRMWGANFAYKPLYPTKFEIVMNFSIPSEVASKLGMNILAAGEPVETTEEKTPVQTEVRSFDGYRVIPSLEGHYPQHPKTEPRSVRPKNVTVLEVEEELKKVAESIQQPSIANTDNRFPAYVILSMKTGLQKQFGVKSTQVILDEMTGISQSIQNKNGWSSFVFLPDDLETCGKYGITPIDTIDPWKIKLALVDLDKALEKKGERIGCVLIVGGDDVVPFHKLPNPTEDTDVEVRSDNPYGSLDTNYFVADWPVGRLPGESGDDPGSILTQLRNVAEYHEQKSNAKSIVRKISSFLLFWNRPWIKNLDNIGYTASVWKQSSQAAFRPVGENKNMFLSPKGKQKAFDPKKLTTASIGYFNLHGVEDGSDWYGQRDSQDESDVDYPIALKPTDLIKNSGNPKIIYSEACYGGHIFEKTEDQSITLTMLGIGVLAVISSTTIAYGSVTTPLIGADLIGYLVMKNLKDGMSVGSAFTQAKVEFVREMNRRQGYLDGEDQKSLISFVLYGDPLVVYDPYQTTSKMVGRQSTPPVIKTICDRTTFDENNSTIAPKMISQAKSLVREYLPGIEYAEVKINNQKIRLEQSAAPGSKTTVSKQSNRVVVSFSKQVNQAEKVHKQFAKVTFDQQGKVVKLAISR